MTNFFRGKEFLLLKKEIDEAVNLLGINGDGAIEECINGFCNFIR